MEKQNRLIDLQKHYNVVDKDLEDVIFNGQTYFLLDKKIKELNEDKKVKTGVALTFWSNSTTEIPK